MQVVRAYVALAFISFPLNFIWECAHLPLYSGYEALGSGWPLLVWASAGDVIYTILIALLIGCWNRKIHWIEACGSREYSAAAILGFLAAILIEYKALWLHRWSYAAAMPIIPILGVGLTPVLQMVFLAPLSLWLTKRLRYPMSDMSTYVSGHTS